MSDNRNLFMHSVH